MTFFRTALTHHFRKLKYPKLHLGAYLHTQAKRLQVETDEEAGPQLSFPKYESGVRLTDKEYLVLWSGHETGRQAGYEKGLGVGYRVGVQHANRFPLSEEELKTAVELLQLHSLADETEFNERMAHHSNYDPLSEAVMAVLEMYDALGCAGKGPVCRRGGNASSVRQTPSDDQVVVDKSASVTCAMSDPRRELKREEVHPAAVLSKCIREARYSIKCCVYQLCHSDFKNDLKDALDRQVKIQILVNEHVVLNQNMVNSINELHPDAQVRIQFGCHGGGFMHCKYFVFDDEKVLIGSYHPTENAATRSIEASVLVESATVAEFYTSAFDELWTATSAQVYEPSY